MQRAELLRLYYWNGESATVAARKYATAHGIKNKQNAPSEYSIRRLVKHFEVHYDISRMPGSGRLCVDDLNRSLVMDIIVRNHHDVSLANISHESGIPKSTVWKILRKYLHLYPYKYRVQQTLSAEHMLRRQTFCVKFLSLAKQDPSFLPSLLVSIHTMPEDGHRCGRNCRKFLSAYTWVEP